MTLLTGKRIFVTGGARGIGRAAAALAAREGAEVIVADRDEAALKSASEDGLRTLAIDIGNDRSVADAVAATGWDRIDGLINNAAMAASGTIDETDADRFANVLNVNLVGAYRMVRAFLPHLEAASGAIVNTTSTQAAQGQPGTTAYSTSKGGLAQLTRAMAVDLAPRGIRANAVAPGFINTDMARRDDGSHEHDQALFQDYYLGAGRIPLRRAGTPSDCAGAFVFLLSDWSAYVTGQTLVVDGGLTATY